MSRCRCTSHFQACELRARGVALAAIARRTGGSIGHIWRITRHIPYARAKPAPPIFAGVEFLTRHDRFAAYATLRWSGQTKQQRAEHARLMVRAREALRAKENRHADT